MKHYEVEQIAIMLEKYVETSGEIPQWVFGRAKELIQELCEVSEERPFDEVKASSLIRQLYLLAGNYVFEEMTHTITRDQDVWATFQELAE